MNMDTLDTGGLTQDSVIMVGASMHKNLRTTLERIEKFVSPLYFTDVNLYGKLYSTVASLDGIFHSSLSKQEWKSITFKDVTTNEFTPVKIGDSFGPTWSTHWFKLVVDIPEKWVGKEVHLCWNSSAEAMLWDAEGTALQAFSGCPDRQIREEYVISRKWDSSPFGSKLTYYVEMACLDMFGAGNCGMIAPPDPNRNFTLNKAHVAVFEPEYHKLYLDLTLLHDFAKDLTIPSERGGDQRGYQALYAANDMINKIQAGNLKQALQIGDHFFSVRNGGKAHRIMAMGHCHIDAAWLWPYDETIRKCARSWVSTLGLLEEFPEMKFTCSQAQQFDWVRQYYPALFERIRAAVKRGQFVPVGGTWVEMDGNIPSGESFIRQFLYGQNFFKEEFGHECQEFWLPDTFGYSAQIPQIIKHVGIERFLTQKLSWSLVNKFPHHNFWWEGIDGSTVLVHFPPGDTYEANCKVGEALKTERNLADKGRASVSMLLYGYGDGGGGPTREMVQRLERLRDVDGCPPMEHGHPHTFFETLAKDGPKLCTWVGELYLELHNGTYTSQAAMKELNRRCEIKLRDAEFFLCLVLATQRKDVSPLLAQLDDAWKKVMLNQFHDVLPGSSIQKAHEDARHLFKETLAIAYSVQEASLDALGLRSSDSGKMNAVFNTLPWEREVVIPNLCKRLKIPSMSYAPIPEEPDKNTLVSLVQRDDVFIVENPHFIVQVDRYGRVVSLFHKKAGLEAVTEPSNQLLIFEDIPLYWDAWDCMDYHLETRQPLNGPGKDVSVSIKECEPLRVILQCAFAFNGSRVTQLIIVDAVQPYVEFETEVEWHENRKFLKVEFPVNVKSFSASYDIQFGHVTRATHKNTSWDSAMFEVCGHKWADISEHGWGVAVLNDSKYGWSIKRNVITLSLLRSPKSPDPICDMGHHKFRYAIMPHYGNLAESRVVQTAYEFNCPPVFISTSVSESTESWFAVEDHVVILETVKPAFGVSSTSPSIVLRLYEAFGSRKTVRVRTKMAVKRITECNGLEQPLFDIPVESDAGRAYFKCSFKPFQIRTFTLHL